MEQNQNYNMGYNYLNPINNPLFQINQYQNLNLNQNNQINQNLNMDMINQNNFFNQINLANPLMNQNFPNEINNNTPIDLFPYIKDTKKTFIFINCNNEKNIIMIPISLSKSDLYSIASAYKTLENSNIILSYKNRLIKNNESFIEEIPDGAEINIIEDRDIPNIAYYDSLIKKYGNNDLRNIYLYLQTGRKLIFPLPGNSTISELIKVINYKLDGDQRNLNLMVNGSTFTESTKELKDIMTSNILTIEVFEINKMPIYFGKNINATLIINEKGVQKEIKITFGNLESTKTLYERFETMIGKKIKKLYLNEKEINREDVKSLLSIGIKNDFTLKDEI